jgi:Mitochondrial K+-H+ exchange-related
MDVYLVPVGPSRHELYCEVPDEPEPDQPAGESPGFFRRLRQRFSEMLAEAERERRQARAAAPQGGWLARARARVMRWVAESIAEQRLLWHLRRQTEVNLYYPDDLDEARAMTELREHLKRDFDKHRFWLTIHALLFVASGVFFFVPGPNFVAYYFAFRLVGHYLSLRGAKQGLSGVNWRPIKSAELTELRRAIGLAPAVRERRVNEVALRLRLEHLASFFERTAVPMS